MMEGTNIHKLLGCPLEFAEKLEQIEDKDFAAKIVKMLLVSEKVVKDLIAAKATLSILVEEMEKMSLNEEQEAALRAAKIVVKHQLDVN